MRRWRSQAKLFCLVLSVAILAGSVLCGSLLLVRSTEQSGVSGTLTALATDRVAVTVRVLDPSGPVADARTAVDTATREAYGAGVEWSSTGWAGSNWSTTPEGVYSFLAELDDPGAEATLVEGAWPTEAPGIALPVAAARSLGLAVGDPLVLGGDDSDVLLRIDALYDAASGPFWENDPLQAQGDAVDFPEPDRSFFTPVHAVGPLLAAPGGIDASGIAPAQLEAVELPSFSATGVDGLTALRARAAEAETAISQSVPHPDGALFVDTELPTALDDVAAGLDGARSAALVVALLLVVVLVASASAVTRLLAEARREEFERLSERGATRAQLTGAVAVDALAVAVVIALLTPWGGVLLHAAVASAPPLNAAGLPRWVLPDSWAVLCAVGVALIVGVMVGLPERGRATSGAVAVAAQAVVVVAAAVLVWRAATGGLDRADLLPTLTPAVLLTAAAIIGGRVAEASARPLALLAVRSRGAVAPLAGWFAARGSGRSSGIVLVALTAGASVIALGTSATWQQAVHDQAAVAVGAPARTTVDAAPADAWPVLRRESLVTRLVPAGAEGDGPSSAAQILALDGPARRSLGEGVDPVAGAGGATILDELPADDTDDTGPLLPAGTVALQARVAVEAPDGVEAGITAVVEDARGTLSLLPLGAVTAPAEAATLTSPDGAIPLADGIRFVAVTATLRGAGAAEVAVVGVSLEDVAAVTDAAASVPVPMADAASWVGSNEDDPTLPAGVAVTDTGVALSVTTVLTQAPVTYGAVGWEPGARVGAVVPAVLADDLDVVPGGDLTAFLAGAPVVVRMVGDTVGVPGAATADDLASLAAGLPSSVRDESTIVVDGRALSHRLAESAAFGPLVDEYWAASITPSPDGASVDADSLARRMLEAPLRAEIPAAASVVVWASLLLALAGFGARAAAVDRARRLEAAQLRAVGLSRRGMLTVMAADTLATALAGIVVGLGAGCVVLALVGPRIAAVASGRAVELILPWQALALPPLALLVALAAVSVALARGQRRLPLPELLRTGADG
ncbi:FtsX-like permease family protein [Rathayibacter oskolensis]|uniref:FtsX-like permease family protein n=1 Tax=Rathayibacter oskolensis TaxID=1891671 RepID=A0A1X7P7H8_9MICO|nr:FtsX-like permease family protein [Rathayibacter oskolensis]SMH45924.1 FtsX-like permease family protein [Rathayibacter oskolensis]